VAKTDREDKAKVKFRVIEFELEGGNAAVQDSMRNLAAAITRGSRPGHPALTAKSVASTANGSSAPPADEDDQVELFPQDPEPTEAEEPAAQESKQRSQRTYATPEVIDIDLTGGEMPLKTFCDQKAPDSDLTKYLVIAAWLKEYRQIESVGINHIHTCYRHMGWFTPKDTPQPMRDLKRRAWFNKTGRSEYAINHVGMNEVLKMGAAA
jgi:hypothetical protein